MNKQNNDIYLKMDFAIFKKYSINLFFKRSPNCIKVCISKLHLFGQQGFDKIILVFFHLLKIHKLLDQGIAKIYITLTQWKHYYLDWS